MAGTGRGRCSRAAIENVGACLAIVWRWRCGDGGDAPWRAGVTKQQARFESVKYRVLGGPTALKRYRHERPIEARVQAWEAIPIGCAC